MTVVGNLILVCGRSGATRARGGLFGEDIRKGEGRLFGFTLEGYPGVIFLALIKVTLKSIHTLRPGCHSTGLLRAVLRRFRRYPRLLAALRGCGSTRPQHAPSHRHVVESQTSPN